MATERVTKKPRNKRTGPSWRTQAERDAINTRAAAWVRPLSAQQSCALKALSKSNFHRVRAGYHSTGGTIFAPATVDALCKRGFAISGFGKAQITAAGRREARRVA